MLAVMTKDNPPRLLMMGVISVRTTLKKVGVSHLSLFLFLFLFLFLTLFLLLSLIKLQDIMCCYYNNKNTASNKAYVQYSRNTKLKEQNTNK